MAKVVLKESQKRLNLPEHSVILDVKTRWNSLYLMVERYVEQTAAIQLTLCDRRIKKPLMNVRLEKLSDDDVSNTDEFVKIMRIVYTSTVCLSSEKSPLCRQILPILNKLRKHFTVKEEDTQFRKVVEEQVWEDLGKRYKEKDIQYFLEEATLMDPRFKALNLFPVTAVWDRLKKALISTEKKKFLPATKKSAFEMFFEEEDKVLLHQSTFQTDEFSISERIYTE